MLSKNDKIKIDNIIELNNKIAQDIEELKELIKAYYNK